jgi:hypothetical protein
VSVLMIDPSLLQRSIDLAAGRRVLGADRKLRAASGHGAPVICLASHRAGASTAATLALGRALAAARYRVAIKDSAGRLSFALALPGPAPFELAPNLTLVAPEATPAVDIVLLDGGVLGQARVDSNHHLLLVVPATGGSVRALPHARPLGLPHWLGVLLADGGDADLLATLARQLGDDVLGTTPAACAAALATKLRLRRAPASARARLPEARLPPLRRRPRRGARRHIDEPASR